MQLSLILVGALALLVAARDKCKTEPGQTRCVKKAHHFHWRILECHSGYERTIEKCEYGCRSIPVVHCLEENENKDF
ncbi:hypothetical protein ACEQ8H_003521 [Pleosporales sp. CAS-2024a]